MEIWLYESYPAVWCSCSSWYSATSTAPKIHFGNTRKVLYIMYSSVLLKRGLAPQTQEPRLQFKQVLDRCGSFPLLSAPHSLYSIEQTLKKIWKDPWDTNVEVRRVDLANWAVRTSPKFTPGVKYQFHQGFVICKKKKSIHCG